MTALPEGIGNVRLEGTRYVVRWRQGGRNRSFSRTDEASVIAKRKELLAQAGIVEDEVHCDLPPFPADVLRAGEWFNSSMAIVMNAMSKSLSSRDRLGSGIARDASGIISDMHKVWKESSIIAEALDQFRLLLEYVEDVQRGRRKGEAPPVVTINWTLSGRPEPPPYSPGELN